MTARIGFWVLPELVQHASTSPSSLDSAPSEHLAPRFGIAARLQSRSRIGFRAWVYELTGSRPRLVSDRFEPIGSIRRRDPLAGKGAAVAEEEAESLVADLEIDVERALGVVVAFP